MDQRGSAVFDHQVSATDGVSIPAFLSEARISSRFLDCLVPEMGVDWQACV
jgi:hypothetical protein